MTESVHKRKKLALLLAQPQEWYQADFINGFRKKAFDSGYDVCIFSMYRKFQENKLREIGESSIYDIVNYNIFDAVCVMADTIQTPGALPQIEFRLSEEYDGPVLFVDKKSETFPSVCMPHAAPIMKVVEHLITVHGFKDIAFLGGKMWHFHTKERLDAFVDTMTRYGLTVRDDRIFYGDFWYTGGRNFADHLLANPDDLPEAIVCANDYMAIGVAEEFEKHGIKVPDDIAVTGYDSVREGRESPSPITSVPVPAKQFGGYAADYLLAMKEGKELPVFDPDYDLFLGGSCGCHCESCVPRVILRPQWSTDASARTVNSSFNRLLEDIVSRQDFAGVMDTVQSYTFQLRKFVSFDLCFNSFWTDPDGFDGDNPCIRGFSDSLTRVLCCGPEGQGEDKIDMEDRFDRRIVLPDLDRDFDHPVCRIFTPVFFDDITFGYAEIAYDDDRLIDDKYHLWLRSLMFGLECLRRQEILRLKNEDYKVRQIKDTLTGLYNYEGFVVHSRPMIERAYDLGRSICVMAVDINDLSSINQKYGRKTGDQVIKDVAEMLSRSGGEGALYCRLGNDEFIAAFISEDNEGKSLYDMRKNLGKLIEQYNSEHDYEVRIASGGNMMRVGSQSEMENLVNTAVSHKNGNKVKEQRMRVLANFTEEQQENSAIVTKILDENRFKYHFQPIVDARNGEVFAYEALMRPDVEPYIGPLTILEFAEHLGRMVDVERATFFNVLKCIDDDPDKFRGKKVFINSIPNAQLNDSDRALLKEKLKGYTDSIVIELTEQSEADDETLLQIKTSYRQLGVQSAVDDYGTGCSNIVNLLRYMPDYVKIDRLLISDIQDNPQKQHFVKEIVKFAHENKFLVLSEGVETSAELRTCIELGTDLIQGYYTGRPAPDAVAAIDPLIREEIFRYNSLYMTS